MKELRFKCWCTNIGGYKAYNTYNIPYPFKIDTSIAYLQNKTVLNSKSGKFMNAKIHLRFLF